MTTKLHALIKSMLKFFASLMNNIIVAILVGTLGVSTLIAWVTGTLDFLIQYMNISTPLWATILLSLLCYLYTYVKVAKTPAKLNQEDKASKSPPYESDDKKLKTIFHANLLWLLGDPDPYCPVCYETDDKLIHMLNFQFQDKANNGVSLQNISLNALIFKNVDIQPKYQVTPKWDDKILC